MSEENEVAEEVTVETPEVPEEVAA